MHLEQKQNISIKQMQRLIMSPQMQQALSIMQLPIMELAQRIEAELAENPLLEEEPGRADDELENEVVESEHSTDLPAEEELSFDERRFELLLKLDEESSDSDINLRHSTPRSSEDEQLQSYIESSLHSEVTLFEHLMRQASEHFDDPHTLMMAKELIGNINSSGYLKTPLEEIALLNNFHVEALKDVLREVQTFDPVGIAAQSVRESLMIQLVSRNKRNSLAYEIIEKAFEELLHNKISRMEKILGRSSSEIAREIAVEIAPLTLQPGSPFEKNFAMKISPDATIRVEGEKLICSVNDEIIQPLRLNRRYLQMLTDRHLSSEDREYIKKKIASAKWFLHTIDQRNTTIEKIAYALSKKQREFLIDPQGKLLPMCMNELAAELNLHESTIVRAVANKYLDCPRGLIALRTFFTNGYLTEQGVAISAQTVREQIKSLIDSENKSSPMSDEKLSKALGKEGVRCSRRTVAKYRAQMQIGNADQRKKYDSNL